MSLRKTANMATPHATYVAGTWTWKVLKVNQPKKSPHREQYATWFVAAKSPNTFGSWEMGDTYAQEVIRFGQLESATDEFREYING
jgi:hypothetical protein